MVKYKEYSCFDHSDFPAHSMFRPFAFESSFSVNRPISDFAGDIAAFCLDIKQEFFMFQFSMFLIKVFEFYNLKSYWILTYSSREQRLCNLIGEYVVRKSFKGKKVSSLSKFLLIPYCKQNFSSVKTFFTC